MRWLWTLLFAASSAAGAQPTADPQASIVFAARRAVAIVPADVVSGPVVRSAECSFGGDHALAVRERVPVSSVLVRRDARSLGSPPPAELSLIVWAAAPGESRVAWRSAAPGGGTVRQARRLLQRTAGQAVSHADGHLKWMLSSP